MTDHKIVQKFQIDEDFDAAIGLEPGVGSPEHQLLVAILDRASRDYLGGQPREKTDASKWLFETAKRRTLAPFSFEWTCEHVAISPDQLRARLIAVKQN